ncbi:septin-4 [Pterocles gutturalis]
MATCPELQPAHEIKRFLKEDSEEAELTQFLRDCPPADSPRKVEPTESRRESDHPLCGVGRVPPGDSSDERDTRVFSRSRPLDFQQHIAAPPPPSPNRPRSPWGQLDPYNSSEDDKEYVGFATLPNQVHRKSVKKGFDFTLMVAGESGLGKSTLVNSLFLTDMYRDRKLLSAEERITQTVKITKHVVDIEEKGVKLRLTIVDTPGFGDAVNNTECWKPVANYIDQQFEQYFRDESGLNRKNIQDNRVHCCIYFISPFGHGLRPLDVEFMRALHQRVNIVPVLAKADTLTPAEVERMKKKVYVYGGFNGPNFLSTAEVYDPRTNQWIFITPMGSRSGAGVIAYGNKVYVGGGFDGITHLRSTEAYNPTTNAWRAIPPMSNPRSSFGIEVLDDSVFIVGGFNGVRTTSNMERYNEQANKRNVEGLGVRRRALSCCVVPGLPNVRDYAARQDCSVENPATAVSSTSSASSLPV